MDGAGLKPGEQERDLKKYGGPWSGSGGSGDERAESAAHNPLKPET